MRFLLRLSVFPWARGFMLIRYLSVRLRRCWLRGVRVLLKVTVLLLMTCIRLWSSEMVRGWASLVMRVRRGGVVWV